MTTPETSNLYANVQNNNNIVWKNISVVDDLPGTGRTTGFVVANFGKRPYDLSLRFNVAREDRELFKWGRILVDVPCLLAERFRKSEGKGIKWISDTTLVIANPTEVLGGRVKFLPREMHALNVRFASKGNARIGARVFNLDVLQYNGTEIVGGVRFALRTHPTLQYEGQNLVADYFPGPRDGDNWFGKGEACGCRGKKGDA
jgi:hypothetical protein